MCSLVKIGRGVGSGLIVGGRRVRGAHSGAGEIGHVTVGTDGGAIQRSREGVPSITLSLPTRYIHSVVEAVHVQDLEAGVKLLLAYLR